MTFIYSERSRKNVAPDGYGKQPVSKKRFEKIVNEEKWMITRKRLLEMYRVK